jgi:hypothetical protein
MTFPNSHTQHWKQTELLRALCELGAPHCKWVKSEGIPEDQVQEIISTLDQSESPHNALTTATVLDENYAIVIWELTEGHEYVDSKQYIDTLDM